MRIPLALLCALLSAHAYAGSIQVGTTTIEVPAPPGYARVVPEMEELNTLAKKFTPPTNTSLALFISEDAVPGALAGDIPDLTRRFSIQVMNKLLTRNVGASDFLALKQSIKASNEKTYEAVKQQLPGLLTKASADLSEYYDTTFLMKVGGLVPLPVHHEDAHSIASSTIARYEYDYGGGNKEVDIVAGTNTILHVNGRVIFLYAYGRKDDLEWTRLVSKDWANAIVVANGRTATSTGASARPSGNVASGIDGGKVASKAVVGGVIGLIAGIIAWLVNRKGNAQS